MWKLAKSSVSPSIESKKLEDDPKLTLKTTDNVVVFPGAREPHRERRFDPGHGLIGLQAENDKLRTVAAELILDLYDLRNPASAADRLGVRPRRWR
jgi:hypothetical protein